MTAADEKKSNDKLDLETLEVVEPEPSEVEENALNIVETVTGEKIRTRKERLEVVDAEPSEEWT
ncbi:MAG: hypothetical protein OXH76_08380 [Boseongicola sp.]|nr:hypothetical protein [Boseongicola sp.]